MRLKICSRAFFLVGCLALLSACSVGVSFSTLGASSSKFGGAEGSIQHVVLVWLKNPKDQKTVEDLIRTSYSFGSIPGVKSVVAGRALASARPTVDSSFDVGVVIAFESVEALRDYEAHPIHREAVKDKLAPVAVRFIVYDIVQ